MPEWIEANIFVNSGSQKNVLLTLIKPLIQTLKRTHRIKSYHFLYEPNNEIRFRVLTTHSRVATITGLIDNLQTNEQIIEVRYPKIPYDGEKTFGEDGWKTTYKFLEAGSDFALDFIDENLRKTPNFDRGLIIHHFLNQTGMNPLDELDFHLVNSKERMRLIITNAVLPLKEQITQLENRLHELEPDEKKEYSPQN